MVSGGGGGGGGGGGEGGDGQSDKKALTTLFCVCVCVCVCVRACVRACVCFFLVLSLFYGSEMVIFKEIYHFSRFQRWSNIFQGGGGGCPTFSRWGPIAHSL